MILYLHPHKQGTLAQMVEQWTENPCVPGSIPGGTTLKTHNWQYNSYLWVFFILQGVCQGVFKV